MSGSDPFTYGWEPEDLVMVSQEKYDALTLELSKEAKMRADAERREAGLRDVLLFIIRDPCFGRLGSVTHDVIRGALGVPQLPEPPQ